MMNLIFQYLEGLIVFRKRIIYIYITEYKACGDKYIGEKGHWLKDRMFNHISNICRNKIDPVSRHFKGICNDWFGAEENMILHPAEQIPDQGNAQISKSLRLKRELYWIKTLGIQCLDGMNYASIRNRDIFITFPFSRTARKAFKTTKYFLYEVVSNIF